jgi:LysM repeat protein
MRQLVIIGILILIGLAAGTGLGLLINKPQIKAARQEAADLTNRLQTAETQSQEKLRVASEEIAKLRADLMRARNDLTRLNTDLARAKAELAQATRPEVEPAAAQPTSQPAPGASQPQPAGTAVLTPPPAAAVTPAAPTALAKPNTPAAGTAREYVIKEGDSFWKIAASQLGSGIRYKEILELNPNLSPDKPLVVGTKIKLPPK